MLRAVLYALVLCVVVGCSSSYRAPIENRGVKSAAAAPSVYHVQRGDTLYSITWRYGLDYHSVAAANGISSPYTIFPGQKLYLKKKAGNSTKYSATKATSKKASTAKTSVPKPSAAPKPVVKKTTPAKSRSKSKALTNPNAKISKWRWPTSGKVIRRFSSSVHKGIDISGKRGDAIYAVASGRVVYAGTGIVGYGELLIVKHNDVYLSAYGHNYRLLVDEGMQVKAGQKIAEKGSSGTDTVKLHFEIRKGGKPVDPQKLLP